MLFKGPISIELAGASWEANYRSVEFDLGDETLARIHLQEGALPKTLKQFDLPALLSGPMSDLLKPLMNTEVEESCRLYGKSCISKTAIQNTPGNADALGEGPWTFNTTLELRALYQVGNDAEKKYLFGSEKSETPVLGLQCQFRLEYQTVSGESDSSGSLNVRLEKISVEVYNANLLRCLVRFPKTSAAEAALEGNTFRQVFLNAAKSFLQGFPSPALEQRRRQEIGLTAALARFKSWVSSAPSPRRAPTTPRLRS